tara:strand:+ start:4130 stop:4570 length:441 start_codon:yes stop_codon:yes gene_type:complete
MASFSLSKSSLNLTPPSITGGPPSKYSLAGQAVNAANIWKANRAGAPDFASMVAQNSVSEANIFNAIKDAEASVMQGGLKGYTSAMMAKKTADRMKAQAKAKARKSMFSSAGGALGTIAGAMIPGAGPLGAMIGGKLGSTVGGLFG